MTYVDVDGLPGTFNSSSADLSLPADAFVLWAGLYWAGDTAAAAGGSAAPNPALRNIASLRVPVRPAMPRSPPRRSTRTGTRYSGFAEVTDQVRAAGVGTYTVANVQAGTGEDRYAAWELIVVYRDSNEPPRNLTVFDGLATVSRATPVATLSLVGLHDASVRAGAQHGRAVEQRGRPHLHGRQRDAELDADLRPGEPGEQRLQLVHHPLRRRRDGQEPQLRQPARART